MDTLDTILSVAGAIGIVVVGIFSVLSMIDRQGKRKREESDAADDRLVSILKGTVAELREKVDGLSNQLGEQAKKILKLETENNTLTRVLQGRDADMKSLYENANATKKFTEENRKLLLGVNKNVERLAVAIEKHLDDAERAKA